MIDFFIGATTALTFLIAGVGLGDDEAGEKLIVWIGMLCFGIFGLWLLTL